ncbi:MAG: hypothetical protein JKY65_26280, partial [Planctomycetes bacterium]|nr:hypothetical protein [Planctomycetota bacterium]
MSDLVRFELLGVAYSIDLSLVESIEPASAEDMDLAEALGVGRAGALRPRERALRLVGGGPALRIGAALSFQALGQALDLPELA